MRPASVKILFGLAFALALVAGCEQRFPIGPLLELAKVQKRTTPVGDTSYVEIYPPWGGFGSPRAIIVGNDQLIYVADYEKNEIVMLDAGGTVLKRDPTILHPISIVQNSKLDLYVGAETIAPNGTDTIGAIYRIFLVRFDTTYISRIDTVIGPLGDTTTIPIRRDTSYFADHDLPHAHRRIILQEPARPHRRYPGIGILPGNAFLVARTGTDNTSFVDPDTRVLRFNHGDTLITPIGDLITRPSGGTAITDIRNVTGLMVFPASSDFILTQSTDGVVFGAVWMVFTSTIDFQGWLPKYDPANGAQRSTDFIHPYMYQNASAAAYDRKRREIFIVDSQLDSVIKFNSKGQFRPESFGKSITSSGQFPGLNSPMGVAFSNDCTLYIADTGNKLIRRFRLSIQTSCN
jgi:hypothetical protein